ncbi:hypothetical protein CFT12S00416_07915 [Campylobacter fetus subsp. testudinum]|uniref:hypothetical protein n=1 Tax=Campylobacter fetus TaxID=196 RepID=UPI000818C72F|nr:hypothetical protein [Campylobacter fetus]OCR87743.1 hypothetical protein CFT12S00416_07915 [Campylobacter fetus subsp. testudinum]OCR98913.1 hypothetical protein A9K75_09335 [Campylobacter fetus subsp. testudinum]
MTIKISLNSYVRGGLKFIENKNIDGSDFSLNNRPNFLDKKLYSEVYFKIKNITDPLDINLNEEIGIKHILIKNTKDETCVILILNDIEELINRNLSSGKDFEISATSNENSNYFLAVRIIK